eukprot:scaffold20770_cov65-Phaeocystis_antarctica.AAC.5
MGHADPGPAGGVCHQSTAFGHGRRKTANATAVLTAPHVSPSRKVLSGPMTLCSHPSSPIWWPWPSMIVGRTWMVLGRYSYCGPRGARVRVRVRGGVGVRVRFRARGRVKAHRVRRTPQLVPIWVDIALGMRASSAATRCSSAQPFAASA